ncbi:UDP-N-acetylenolpyruvoylglucosamine reductase [Clostridia bacterium]|nr:UDP-N-acetylenolpyruvoylglucosamine reductase [Clostridia bacterium]
MSKDFLYADYSDLKEDFEELLGAENVFLREPMSKHTSFRTGGPAGCYLRPKAENLWELMQYIDQKRLVYHTMGNGTNLLISDNGIGLMIEIGQNMSDVWISADKPYVYAGGGASLSRVAHAAEKAGLTGLEFASGIPGTVGGAISMNAGAYGSEMKDVLLYADVLRRDNTYCRVNADEMKFSYRRSLVSEMYSIVTGAAFALKEGEPAQIKARTEELRQQRAEKQPIEYPSAGSTFKRPEGHFAGKLIADAGLKGLTVGGAQVSEKHAGFIINRGGATAKDIVSLMEIVQEKVKEEFGVELEQEVRAMGYF